MRIAQLGSARPMATSFSRRRAAVSAATRRSQANMSSAPPAIAWPPTAATVGIGKRNTRSMVRAKVISVVRSSAAPSVGRSFRSRPAEKTPGRPVMMTAPGLSRSARSSAAPRASKKPRLIAFTFPSSRAMRAMRSPAS